MSVMSPSRLDPEDVGAILDVVAARRGVDLRDYRGDAVARGMTARLDALRCADARAYRDRLDPAEVDELLKSIVPPVSAFHRDADTFHALRASVIPALARSGSRVRAWSIGTATGEEAWTTAMLLASAGCRAYEVLATDIDEASLRVGAAGVYPTQATNELPDDLRRRFLAEAPGGWRVREELREHVRFVRHDAMGPALSPPEAVVARFQLVLMRNVLLYFERRFQLEAFKRLAGILPPGGALVLGSVERLPPPVKSFEPWPGLPAHVHVYRRKEEG
jgi:chemotaxis methyl-accepting protein methylase